MNLRCIIFDMDGTLTQTNQLIFDSFNAIVERYQGKRLKDLEITALFGPPEEGALAKVVGEDLVPKVMGEYLEFYRSNHQRLATLYPGIRPLLDYLKSRKQYLALFTGKGVHTTRITLEEFGLTDLFDCVITGNDVEEHKPSGEGIRTILERFGLKPDQALMVGDSVADVKAARDAGVPVVSVVWDSYARERVVQMNGENIFETVADLHEWLRRKLE